MTPDDDDRPRRARPSSAGRVGLLLGVVGCVVVLGCGGIIAAGVYWGVRAFQTDLPAAAAAADGFLALLQRGRTDDAYAAASAGFRGRQTPEEFRAFLGRFETLAAHTSRTIKGVRLFQGPEGKQVFVEVTLHAPKNATTCTLILVDEGDAWRVERVTVP